MLRIAQVAPLVESVPPKLYGGTERIVSFLTEELVRQGHDVTLFASGDSITEAELVACSGEALRLDEGVQDALPHHLFMLEQVRQRANEFDVIHFHLDHLHLPVCRTLDVKSLTTFHNRLDNPDVLRLYEEFDDAPLVSISRSQQRPLSAQNWLGVVLHGLPTDSYPLGDGGGDYLAFLGRLSPEKRPDRAIEIAAAAGMRLKIAAKINDFEQDYVAKLQPLLDQDHVEFVGEIAEHEKAAFIGNARALLFPIDWPEPFGLAMIEAMAMGTPVVAWRNGAVPEVIDHGISGYIVDTKDEAVDAVKRVGKLDRKRVRQQFKTRFSAERMAKDYVRLYHRLIAENGLGRPLVDAPSLSPASMGAEPMLFDRGPRLIDSP